MFRFTFISDSIREGNESKYENSIVFASFQLHLKILRDTLASSPFASTFNVHADAGRETGKGEVLVEVQVGSNAPYVTVVGGGSGGGSLWFCGSLFP